MLLCNNGNFLPAGVPLLTSSNRSFKWGDGLIETIRVQGGQIPLWPFHAERLFGSMKLLKMDRGDHLKEEEIFEQIVQLCHENHCASGSRVRLAVYREENNEAGYVIEALPLPKESIGWNEKGLMLGLYPYAHKPLDGLSNLKTASALPYIMAGLHAKENGADDCIVLNSANGIADTSRANIFLVKSGKVFTPALNQGCVAGVMRRYCIEGLKKMGIPVHQEALNPEELLHAEEVFLTNAVQGLRWVRSFQEKEYSYAFSTGIYTSMISTIFP